MEKVIYIVEYFNCAPYGRINMVGLEIPKYVYHVFSSDVSVNSQ